MFIQSDDFISYIPSTFSFSENTVSLEECFHSQSKLINIENLNIPSSIIKLNGMFKNCSSLIDASTIHFNGFSDTNIYLYLDTMFQNCSSLSAAPQFNLSSNRSLNINTNNMFYNCSALTEINFDIPNDYPQTLIFNNINYMCYNCSQLINIPTGIYNVKQGNNAFANCNTISSIPASSIFYRNNKKIDNRSFNNTFYNCTSLTTCSAKLDDSIKIWPSLFNGCVKLENIDLDNSVLSSCFIPEYPLKSQLDMQNAFYNCANLPCSLTVLNNLSLLLFQRTDLSVKAQGMFSNTPLSANVPAGYK